jgi:hypothetical protein
MDWFQGSQAVPEVFWPLLLAGQVDNGYLEREEKESRTMTARRGCGRTKETSSEAVKAGAQSCASIHDSCLVFYEMRRGEILHLQFMLYGPVLRLADNLVQILRSSYCLP